MATHLTIRKGLIRKLITLIAAVSIAVLAFAAPAMAHAPAHCQKHYVRKTVKRFEVSCAREQSAAAKP